MRVILNPGTGPVADASEANAIACARQLAFDISDPAIRGDRGPVVLNASFERAPQHDDGEGRYAFVFRLGERSATIDIPGRPVERVRYIDQDSQNIWDYPRLYINGSSFVWYYVVALLREELNGTIEEE